MKSTAQLFSDIGEPYAAGFFEDEKRGYFYRFSKALRRFYESRPVNEYSGGRLYPSGLDQRGDFAVQPDCAKTFNPATGGKGTLKGFYDPLKKKSEEAARIMLEVREKHNFALTPSSDSVTISGYTHSIPYFERVLKEGFDSYIERIEQIEDADMRDGLMEVVSGLRNYHGRCLENLKSVEADPELIAALEKVPFKPAENIYEAIVGWNYLLYLDNLDNIGWIDEGLTPFYHGEDVTAELREMFENVAINDGWSCSVGPNYNDLTKQCLVAVKGLFRPMMELRVTPDMPDGIWELAEKTLFSGGGQPAFYNEPMVQDMLLGAYPELSAEDRMRFSGAGCTETNLAGLSNVGGIDANLNLALVFEKYLQGALLECTTFEEFYNGFCEAVKAEVKTMLSDVYRNHENRAKYLPNPMRSLLIDDCIDRGLDYNNRGARFNGTLTAESGLINVIDSLAAVHELIFEQKRYTPEVFLDLLSKEDAHFFQVLKNCPHYGMDDDKVNHLAYDFSGMFYACFENEMPYRGGRCLPTSHQFNRYTKEGKRVGPTPDGRKAGEPLCDSLSPLSNKKNKGPTAALLSASHLQQRKILGIPVYNLTINRHYPNQILKGLIQGYFKASGVQVQITILSKEELKDAMEHPEKHEDLVIRVGGYSEFFNRLTPELQMAVYQRTVFESS